LSEEDVWQAIAALLVLLGTGVAMVTHYDLWDSSTLQARLGLVGLVPVLTLVHLRYPRLHALQARSS
jgi:hypothetical protein